MKLLNLFIFIFIIYFFSDFFIKISNFKKAFTNYIYSLKNFNLSANKIKTLSSMDKISKSGSKLILLIILFFTPFLITLYIFMNFLNYSFYEAITILSLPYIVLLFKNKR